MPNSSESPCNNIAGYPRQSAGVGNSLKITGPLIDHKAANAISKVIRFVWAEKVSSFSSVSARPDSSAQAFSLDKFERRQSEVQRSLRQLALNDR
jgi:hypothetical protein